MDSSAVEYQIHVVKISNAFGGVITDISVDPNNSNRLFAFEKIGPGACVVDLENFSLEQYIEPIDGCYFYGHGMPSKDGLVTYQTETDIITKKGYIPIRDTNTLQVLDYFPTYGEKPHDCHLIENGKVMAITNGGSAIGRDEEKPSVTFVEIASRKLLEKIELDNSFPEYVLRNKEKYRNWIK